MNRLVITLMFTILISTHSKANFIPVSYSNYSDLNPTVYTQLGGSSGALLQSGWIGSTLCTDGSDEYPDETSVARCSNYVSNSSSDRNGYSSESATVKLATLSGSTATYSSTAEALWSADSGSLGAYASGGETVNTPEYTVNRARAFANIVLMDILEIDANRVDANGNPYLLTTLNYSTMASGNNPDSANDSFAIYIDSYKANKNALFTNIVTLEDYDNWIFEPFTNVNTTLTSQFDIYVPTEDLIDGKAIIAIQYDLTVAGGDYRNTFFPNMTTEANYNSLFGFNYSGSRDDSVFINEPDFIWLLFLMILTSMLWYKNSCFHNQRLNERING